MARFTALWWWIDRWRKSTAYTDMALEEQGGYRNLLDEANLRGGALPNDEWILARACGDALAWPRIRGKIMQRFELRADGWHNLTLDSVIKESTRRAEKQARYRNNKDNASGNSAGNTDGSPDPDPSPSLDPEPFHEEQPPLAARGAGLPLNGDGHPDRRKYGGATLRELQNLETDPRVVAVGDAWVSAFRRPRREIGVLRAAAKALAGGYDVDTIALVVRVAGRAVKEPERFSERSSFRWTVEHRKLAPEYLMQSSTLGRLIPEAEAFEREDD